MNWTKEIEAAKEALNAFWAFSPIQEPEQVRFAEELGKFVNEGSREAFLTSHSLAGVWSMVQTMRRNVLRQQGKF